MLPDVGHDRTAREALERSWAVAALDEQLRLRARTAAELSWERLVAPSRAKSHGRLLTKAEQGDVELVVHAYERAALERVEALLRDGTANPQRVRQELRVAASELFTLLRVLPLADPLDPDGYLQAVRLSAVALVAERQAELASWLRAHGLQVDPESDAGARWDEYLRRGVIAVWLDLLGGPTPEAAERAFDRLGALREQRMQREAELLANLPIAGAQQMRLALVGLYGLAEAAAGLVMHLRRGPHAHIYAQLARQFDAVRGTTVGGSAFDRVLPWLHVAAESIASRQTAQIALPGLLT